MATHLGRVVNYHEVRHEYHEVILLIKRHDPLITWSCKTYNKLLILMIHYFSAYGHQTRQDGDLP